MNSLFLIDDTKDADTNEFKGEVTEAKTSVTTKINVTPEAVIKSVVAESNAVVKAAVESTSATPAKKSGPWGAKKAVAVTTQSSGDLY